MEFGIVDLTARDPRDNVTIEEDTSRARHCWGDKPQVWECTGPTVLDALAALIDELARRGNLNPTVYGASVWDDPDYVAGGERVVLVTVSP